jgi:PTH1 family peptidyl-tRNA hydrolase
VHVVFGIGNPGPEYDGTRHNVGFRVVDALLARARARAGPLFGLEAEGAEARLSGRPALLVKPLTYVNRCGPVLAALRARAEVPLERLLVVVDDFHLPLGRLRLKASGSDGGHNGLASIAESLGTEAFPRLRIGVGARGATPAEAFVLSRFPPSELPLVERAVARAAEAVEAWIRVGLDRAANEVNRRDLDGPGPGP